MAFLTAGYIDGSRVKAEILRRALWASTGGATGVAQFSDLKVLPTGTPSTSVVISAGSAIIESAFAGGSGQSYVVSNDAAVTVQMPSAAGAYFLMLVVNDPQYAGQSTPSNPLDAAYTSVSIRGSKPTDVPYIILARITVPTTGGSVTAANIEDYRSLARPRRDRSSQVYAVDRTYSLGTGYQQWPPSYVYNFFCPPWATECNIRIDLAGVECMVDGYVRAELKPTFNGDSSSDTISLTVRNQKSQRFSAFAVCRYKIPASARGTNVQIGLRAAVKVGAAGAFQLDSESNVACDVEFYERAL